MAKSSSNLQSLRPILRQAAAYPRQWALALMFLVFAAGTTLAVPFAFREVVDAGFSNLEGLRGPFLALLVLSCLLAVATALRFYLMSWLGERVVADLREKIFSRVLHQPPIYFETLKPGEVLSRLTADTTLIQALVGTSISMALRSAVTLLGGVVLMIITSPALAGLMVVLLLAVILPVLALGRRVRKASRESQDRIADSSALAGELLSAMPTVQALGREPYEEGRFRAAVELAFQTAKDRIRRRSALTAIAIVLAFAVMVLVLWLGAREVVQGNISAGELTQFVLYAAIVAGAIAALAEVFGDLQRAAGATERLVELLDLSQAPHAPQAAIPAPIPAPIAIAFRGICFAYPSRPEAPALQDFDLDIPEGQTVALVGSSGAGKTTVFQLLLGFYAAQSGQILFNGRSMADWGIDRVRASIGLVPQDPVLFSDDAMGNIRYGRLEASDEEVMAAARAAHAHEFLSALPEGYASFLGERGIRLSGGQRQRIAIARALLRNPPLLLLDEATSALDTRSEREVQRALEVVLPGRTALVIAHRLSTVQKAHKIVVMEAGRVVAQGRHEELLESSPRYRELAGQLD